MINQSKIVSKLYVIVFFCLLLVSCKTKKLNRDPIEVEPKSIVSVQWGQDSFLLNRINAGVLENNLNIWMEDSSNQHNGFGLEFQRESGKWALKSVHELMSPLDCLYVVSSYRIISQEINWDNADFKHGDTLRGSIELWMLGRKPMLREPEIPFIDKRKWDSIHLKGNIIKVID